MSNATVEEALRYLQAMKSREEEERVLRESMDARKPYRSYKSFKFGSRPETDQHRIKRQETQSKTHHHSAPCGTAKASRVKSTDDWNDVNCVMCNKRRYTQNNYVI